LEAVDFLNSNDIFPAFVKEVKGPLLLISFDGYPDQDQWVHFESRDIYPLGWCEAVGYNMKGKIHTVQFEYDR